VLRRQPRRGLGGRRTGAAAGRECGRAFLATSPCARTRRC
jgi:hypothetical protein